MGRSDSRRKNSTKKWKKVLLSVLAVLLLLVGGVAVYSLYTVNKALTTMHEPIDRDFSAKRDGKVQLSKKEPLSILLIGIDKESGSIEKGRSDTMIVLTVNPATESMKMVSIPRDTRTEIIGQGIMDKINHAHAYGGVEMSIPTVENFLDIPIDYYVKINMEGFKEIVDSVGGVEVNNSFAFTEDGKTFDEGTISLDGDSALTYVRMRKQDPRGDFGRADRQKQVVQAVINKGASLAGFTKLDNLIGAIGENVKTDLSSMEMVTIQRKYAAARHNMETVQLTGSGATIGGVYYLQVAEDERLRVSSILREHLGLE
ncbi:LCP family protein required for cell wall assembly [Bacillus tianshenii]|uniref:Polyisoprenyl-teichoic acid--peptidoglycan teichoic acid transferase TagU n=1 Tax=Sutcliffiella tianshenii TaxID=1463404 RepID=A0ABS2NV52_9BACI|nr:LCP family protein [Bacillus tianshenii]MBM7618504.1 LCP family protein required for cell wall assembly [Bacillus tianshenii]